MIRKMQIHQAMEIKVWEIAYLASVDYYTESPILPITIYLTCGKSETCIGCHNATVYSCLMAQDCWGWISVNLGKFTGLWKNMNVNEGRLGSSNNTRGETQNRLSSASHLQLWYQKVQDICVFACFHAHTHIQYHIYIVCLHSCASWKNVYAT